MPDVPEDAFSGAMDYSSIDWGDWFPGHCYICHVVNAGEAKTRPHNQVWREDQQVFTCLPDCEGCLAEEDTSKCGPHCDVGGKAGQDAHHRLDG